VIRVFGKKTRYDVIENKSLSINSTSGILMYASKL